MITQQDVKLVKIEYKEDIGYSAKFKIQNIDITKIKQLLKQNNQFKEQWDTSIITELDNIYLVKIFEKEDFEEDYPFIVENAQNESIPPRIDPVTAKKEFDLLSMENEGAWLFNMQFKTYKQ